MKATSTQLVILVSCLLLALTQGFAPNPFAPSRVSGSNFLVQLMSEEGAADAASEEASQEPPKPAVKCPDCDLCDGSGRILGGLGVVLPWWPIKAYRPCPNFIERGGVYERSGQGLDEIAFGRDSTFNKDS